MVVNCVTIYVREENINDFIQATKENHICSVKETGNLRFDLLQCRDNKARFFLYEAYLTENDALLHKKTDHYKKWRDTVAPMMAKPREGISHSVIYPENVNEWK